MQKPPFTGPDVCGMSARDTVGALKRKEVSPGELITAMQERHASVDGTINALPTVCIPRAQAHAARLSSGEDVYDGAGALHGLPIAIKDLTPVAGVRSTWATKGLANNVAETSAPMVERLEHRGGIVVGKANTPEMGAGGNTFNDVFGQTHNPWKHGINAGGSSGGSSAALASGQVWLAQGSDLAGSLRTPACYCGVVGMRPSPGYAGGGPSLISFTVEGLSGPMARDVEDCALFLDSMAGFDPREPMSLDPPATPFRDAVQRAEAPARIAFSADLGGFAPVEPEVRELLTTAVSVFSGTSIVVDEVCPDLSGLYDAYITLRGFLWAATAGRLPADIREHFKQTLEDNIQLGEALTGAQIIDAQRDRSALQNRMCKFFEIYDVLACAVVGMPAGSIEEEFPTMAGNVALTGYIDWLRFSYLATTTGLPALSLPIGLTANGIPMGLQLIGPPRGDAKLLAVAKVFEDAIGFGNAPIDPVP